MSLTSSMMLLLLHAVLAVLSSQESSYPVTDGLYTDHMYRDLSVPVYTTLKRVGTPGASVTMTLSEPEAAITVAAPSRANTTSVTIHKQLSHTSLGATKRGVSCHSCESIVSDMSSDYAVPPDEVSIQTDSSDNSEPKQELLKYTTEQLRKDRLEKCGYLTKLGCKVQNWKRRWFVLKNREMLYYKSPNDAARKPQEHISLNGQTRFTKTEGAHTFQIITIKKTHYLTADNREEMDHWIRVLHSVLKKVAADQVIGQTRAKEVMKGWLIKTGQIHFQDVRIEEVDRSCDSEMDSDDTTTLDYTLEIYPILQAPSYLMIATKQEKDSWLYHGTGNVGSEYEQIISKLMEIDGDPTSIYWKHPILLHTKDVLTGSLTTLPSEHLQSRAIALFKSCHMFCNTVIDLPQTDYHVSLTQTIMDVCLQHHELYCQLICQTSRHPPQHKSGMQVDDMPPKEESETNKGWVLWQFLLLVTLRKKSVWNIKDKTKRWCLKDL